MWACGSEVCDSDQVDVAEYLLEYTQIDPLAKKDDGNHALMLGPYAPPVGGAGLHQGLRILELFHRKAPQALDLPGGLGKEVGSTLTLTVIPQGLRRYCVAWSGYRPIHRAATLGDIQCLKRLLELGVDRDPRQIQGATPLHLAASFGEAECVKALLDAGADVRAKTREARALDSPTSTGNWRCIVASRLAGRQSLSLCRRGS